MTKPSAHPSTSSPDGLPRHDQAFAYIDGMGAGVWDWDIETGDTYFNEAWASMLGYELRELAPLTVKVWIRLTHPEDLKLAQARLDQYFKGDIPDYDIEIRMRHKAGHWVWIHDRGKVYARSAEGTPLRMAGTHIDISARKDLEFSAQSRQALQELTRRLSLQVLKSEEERMAVTIEDGLGELGNFLVADRAYIFQLDYEAALMHNTHEWVRDGISEEKDNLQNVPWAVFPWFMEHILENESLYIPDVQLIPDEHAELREALAAQSICSLAVVPIPGRERTLGFWGIDFVSKHWNMTKFVDDAMWYVSGIFSGAFERLADKERILTLLKETRESYVTVSDQTESLIIETDESLAMTFLNEAQKMRYGVDAQVLGRLPQDIFSAPAPIRQPNTFSRGHFITKSVWRGLFLNVTLAGELVIESTYIKRLPTKMGYIKVGEDITEQTKRSEWMRLANITHQSSTRIKISELALERGLEQIVATPPRFILPQYATFLPNPEHNPFGLEVITSPLAAEGAEFFHTLCEHFSANKDSASGLAQVFQDEQGMFQTVSFESDMRPFSRLEAMGVRVTSKYFDYGWFLLWHNNPVKYYTDVSDTEYLRELGTTLSDVFNSMEMTVRISTMARAEHLTQLAAGVAHEIRNPLAVISMASEALEVNGYPAESINAKALRNIQKSVLRATRVVEDLMNLQSPPRVEKEVGSVNVQTLVDEAIALISFHLRNAKIGIQRELPAEDVFVLASKNEMLRVLVNILLNSIQAIGKQGMIQVRLKEEDRWVELQLADTGGGVEQDELRRLTQPFYTSKKGQHGTGMGLFLSNDIMKRFDGEMTLLNNEIGGLTVILKMLKQGNLEV